MLKAKVIALAFPLHSLLLGKYCVGVNRNNASSFETLSKIFSFKLGWKRKRKREIDDDDTRTDEV